MNQEETTRETRKYFEINKIESMIHQNLWNIAKVVFWVKFTALNTNIRKERC
jgi:hypothetical protein